MKKFFPLFVSSFVFVVFIIVQVGFDSLPLGATQSKTEEVQKNKYEVSLKSFTAKDIQGAEFKKGFYKDKIVILNFWASWCQPCLVEFPTLVELRKKFSKDELEIIAINTDDENQMRMIKKIKKDYALNFNIVKDEESDLVSKFSIEAIPVSIVYFNGKVIDVHNGAEDFASVKNILTFKNLLKK